MSERIPEWQSIFGAKVKSPIDLPDDILKDAVTFATEALSKCPSDDDEANNRAIRQIKEHMDEMWSPNWHVICGRNFGSLVTHEAKRFVYFYAFDRAIMIYKS
ncbi:hypothetical protein HJC23_008066 [Cyclotella cryptica]|uniref:Dynein light chain n=1 Tax=Cyclotella cryptica TaxID=29204 RepID=A0ABD3NYX9_9STRA|eukprot:CCRYP_018633-RA/>CCRYP_018633-RA protein AED:0.15 eAED:0.14 QI:0/0/0/0.5/1/1/2/0/102